MEPFDPRGQVNRALLVGVSDYDNTEPPHGVPGNLPAVRHNLTELKRALLRGGVLSEAEIVVSDSPTQDEFVDALHAAVDEARGLLLVYFAGHGAIPSAADELFLQLRNARVIAGDHAVFRSSEMFTDVLGVLGSAKAHHVVVVLDCCFAGNAARLWEAEAGRRRALLLMSVQANHRVDAGDDASPTPFTGELVRLLDERREWGFQDLAEAVRARMKEVGHRTLRDAKWEPQSRAEPEADVLLAVATGPKRGPDPKEEPKSRSSHLPWWRRLLNAIRNAGAAVLATLAVWARAAWTWFLGRGVLGRIIAIAAALGLLVGLVIGGVTVFGAARVSCAPPLEVRVLTDPDLETTVRTAANAYLTAQENTTGEGCRRTGITVYSARAADAVNALREQTDAWQQPRDEDTNPQRDVGPQPDVWIPASATDVARVTAEQDTRAYAQLFPDNGPFAYSPLVLAVPQKLAAGTTDTDRVGSPLVRFMDDLRYKDKAAEVRRADPEFTDSALLATVGLYGTGTTDAAAAEQRVAQAGPPSSSAADLLCTLPNDNAVDNRTAALAPEFLMKSGVGCDRTTRVPRVAEYPDDVPGLTPTFVGVRWQEADRDTQARDAAVAGFRAWLTGRQGLAAFADAGFRSTGAGHALLDTKHVGSGIVSLPGPLPEKTGQQAMDTVLTEYRGANGPGRVLFLLDSSGSMGAWWDGPSGGPGLVKQSLVGLGDQDEYGVWAVAGTDGAADHTVLLPFGRHRRTDAEHTIDSRAGVQDAEADPHAALLAALDDMAHRGIDDDHPQLIVYITDDEDNNRLTGSNLDDVLKKARAVNVPVAMVSLAGGGCAAGKADARVSQASGGRCLDAGGDLGAGLKDEVAHTGTGEG
ncbi:substrate-binding domain-containing protein [Streptomyces sp. IMTB 2501]|uniref:substrate-binding domain-containing protein n=1 Tax=Streptomyces sp. IMTB 2501 TaxID=1776340 RepID=UPI000D1A8FE8|nr:substrate-binding domain-containing protein [Streptomyces sp. IMTB 2501]